MKKLFTIVCVLCCGLGFSQEIEALIIQGNNKTKERFIRNLIKADAGNPVDSLQIDADIRRLKRLPGIAHAYFEIKEKDNNKAVITYIIEENFTIIPSANVYTTNNDEFAFRVGLFEFNGLGRNIMFGGYFQRDIYNSYGINFRAPYLFSNSWGLAINHQNLTTLEPVFLEAGTADYKYNNTSYEVLALYEINFDHRLELGVNLFTETYSYKSGATAPTIPLQLEVDKLLFKLIYEYNKVHNHFQYVAGFKSIFNFQYVTSSDQTLPEFLLGFNDFVYYKRVGERGNWASRLRLGLATNNETPFAPFSVDNNLNIRGVGNTIDRGTAAIVLNTEYRHTLYEKNWFVLQSNIFIDAGSWRNPGGDLGDFGENQNLRIYPGVGLRFIHKRIFNAVFRIDYGYGVTQDATNGFVFGIRQYF
ncbi:MAG: outer membrane protein assembly factor [Flavobacteriales bacterium]|uniref:outer membrane protein assembly factor n=1 Tax=Candidatus Ulvibacter alkanivorans TaxID=2267620 RepID=UPI000DF46DD5|nr:outer membrane protein assembly factor [Candidatus Ulvibacter alkanivorans]MCH2489266.1 outer membrane protein assembly factor [Flavobacteriales bacterium]